MMSTFLKMDMRKDYTLEIDTNRQWVELPPIVVDANEHQRNGGKEIVKIYVGMVDLANGEDKPKATNIFCGGFNKENVKTALLLQAFEVLKEFSDVYTVERDVLDPDDSIILQSKAYPRWIRYYIREIEMLKED